MMSTKAGGMLNSVCGDELARNKKMLFLQHFSKMGNITAASEAAGIARKTYYAWRDSDPEFAAAAKQAEEAAADYLEAEVFRRATEGVEEPQFYQGKQVATVMRKSDTLLMFMLKGLRPEKFRDNVKHEVSGQLNFALALPEGFQPEQLGASGAIDVTPAADDADDEDEPNLDD